MSAPLRRVVLRDMRLAGRIGVHPHEQAAPQRLLLNLELTVEDEAASLPGGIGPDELGRVVDYERLATTVRRIVGSGHVRLVETLAERLAMACLEDGRVRTARVRVEKLDVFEDVDAAGVEIVRHAPAPA